LFQEKSASRAESLLCCLRVDLWKALWTTASASTEALDFPCGKLILKFKPANKELSMLLMNRRRSFVSICIQNVRDSFYRGFI